MNLASISAGSITSGGSAAAVITPKTIERISGLEGHWKGDAGVNGKLAVDLNGSQELGEPGSKLVTGTKFSALVVFKYDATGSFHDLHGEYGSAGQRTWRVSKNASELFVFSTSHDGTNIDTLFHATVLSQDTWYFGFVRYDESLTGSEKSVRIFDTSGVEVGVENTGTITSSLFNGTNKLYAGSNDGGSYLDGKLDQSIVWGNYYLTNADITAIVNSGNGIKKGDLSGSENYYINQTTVTGAWYDYDSPKRPGRESSQESHAVELDGSADEFSITAAASTDFNFDRTDSFTIGGWIYKTSTDYEYLVTRNQGTSPFRGWYMAIDANEKLEFNLVNTSSTLHLRVVSDVAITLNKWEQVGFGWDGSDGTSTGVSLIINGSIVASTVTIDTLSTNSINGSYNFVLGNLDAANGNRFTGIMDEFYIYDADVSAQASTLYNGGVIDSAETLYDTNLVSNWRFNGQTVETVGDDNYGTNDLTPTSIVQGDLVGGKDSLDLVPSATLTAADGHITGQVINEENISQVTDFSGLDRHLNQATIATQPLYDYDGSILYPGGTALSLSTTDTSFDPSGDHSFIIAIKVSNSSGKDLIEINGTDIYKINSSLKLRAVGFATPMAASTALTANVYGILGASYDSATGLVRFYFNGSVDGSDKDVGSATGTAGAITSIISATLAADETWNLKRALWYNRKLSDSEHSKIATQISNETGIAI